MTVNEGRQFTEAKLIPDTILECPGCKQGIPLTDWVYHENGVYCETCQDDHATVECPRCEHSVDQTWANLKVVT